MRGCSDGGPSPIPYPGRYVIVKQFTVDRPEAQPLPDTAPLHYYNPFYLRLDLKTHSTRLLHNSIQQTSVDATPEHHVNVVSGLAAAGVLPEAPATSPVQLQTSRGDRRSCSIVSAGKKTVAFADTVDVCGDGGRLSSAPHRPPVTDERVRPANVFQVHSQTGEVVGDVLIERKRKPPSPPPPPPLLTPSPTCITPTSPIRTPSPGDDDVSTASSCSRRMRHEMFCRRRQTPVFSCDDVESVAATAMAESVAATAIVESVAATAMAESVAATAMAESVAAVDESTGERSVSLSSVYESCYEDLPVVVLDAAIRPPLRRSAAAVNGYANCCSPS